MPADFRLCQHSFRPACLPTLQVWVPHLLLRMYSRRCMDFLHPRLWPTIEGVTTRPQRSTCRCGSCRTPALHLEQDFHHNSLERSHSLSTASVLSESGLAFASAWESRNSSPPVPQHQVSSKRWYAKDSKPCNRKISKTPGTRLPAQLALVLECPTWQCWHGLLAGCIDAEFSEDGTPTKLWAMHDKTRPEHTN